MLKTEWKKNYLTFEFSILVEVDCSFVTLYRNCGEIPGQLTAQDEYLSV